MAEPTAQQNQEAATGTLDASEFDSLLKKEFKPKTDEAKDAVERAVRTLAEQALAQTKLVSPDVVKSIEAIIAQIDRKLTEQINLILHHPDVQKLEGAWRGLHFDLERTSFFTSKAEVVSVTKQKRFNWRRTLFAWMLQNSPSIADYMRLPPERVVELGVQVEL